MLTGITTNPIPTKINPFQKIDRNQDGSVDTQELATQRAKDPEKAARAEKWLKRADADGDGKLSAQEYENAPREKGAASVQGSNSPSITPNPKEVQMGQKADQTMTELFKKRFEKMDQNPVDSE